MADDSVVIRISAEDAASGVLVKIGSAAKKTGDDLERAGEKGKRGLEKTGEGAKKADQALRTFERQSLAVGAALGAVALATIKVSGAYQAQTRQFAAISRMYGDGADQALKYAESMQRVTQFSNDAARQSEILFSTLQQNYGISQTQIEQLMMRTADLATLHGRSLTEVTQMVQNALRGEAEYIEQIGVSLNQTFVANEAARRGLGNFITDMDAAQQAAFRFQLLMEQTANAQGFATERMEGFRGVASLAINSFQDLTQSLGGVLGPIADVAGQFQGLALWAPLIGSQVGRMSAILINSARSGEMAANAMKLLNFAMGPVGLAAIAIGAGLTILASKYLDNKRNAELAAMANKRMADSYRSLQDSINQLFTTTGPQAGLWAMNMSDTIQTAFDDMNKNVEAALKDEDDGWFKDQFENRATVARRAMLENMKVTDDEKADINASLQSVFALLANPNIDTTQFESEFAAFWDDLWIKVGNGTIDSGQIDEEIAKFGDKIARELAAAQQKIQAATRNFNVAAKVDDLRIDGLDEIADQYQQFADMADIVVNARQKLVAGNNFDLTNLTGMRTTGNDPLGATALANFNLAYERTQQLLLSGNFDNAQIIAEWNNLIQLWADGKISGEALGSALINLSTDMDGLAKSADTGTDKIKGMAEEFAKAAEAADKFKQSNKDIKQNFQDNLNAIYDSYASAFNMDDPLSKINASSLGTQYSQLAKDIQTASGALDTVFRVAVENTNAFVDQAHAVKDWATELINVEGEYGKIDDLISKGLINRTQYNQAQRAYNDIVRETAEIEDDVAVIQAKQAPYIRDYLAGQENLLDQLSKQDAVQQRITLGWMDSTTAAQAYNIVQQGIAIQSINMGEAGDKAFHDMIAGAIATNPYLFDILESMGLISGTPIDFTVNTGALEGAASDVDNLNRTVGDLIDLLDNGKLDKSYVVNIDVKVNDPTGYLTHSDGKGEGRGLPGEQQKHITIEVGAVAGEIAGGSIPAMLGITPDKPIVQPVTVSLETGGAGLLGQAGGILGSLFGGGKPVIAADAVVEDVKMPEDTTVTVTFEADTVSVDQAMGEWSSKGSVGGPLVTFTADTVDVDRAMGDWVSRGEVQGPIVKFTAGGQNDIQTVVDSWRGYEDIDGPRVMFGFDDTEVGYTVGHWNSFGNTTGPIVVFSSDTVAPARALGEWVSKGSVSGPTIVFNADTSAVENAIAAYSGNSVIGTKVVNIVTAYSSTGRAAGGLANGGLVHYANGGLIPVVAAEGNRPELARFANGGTAMLEREGVYALPAMTHITPAHATRGMEHGKIEVNVTGNTFYGGSRPDLDEWAAQTLVPAFAEEFRRQREASGA